MTPPLTLTLLLLCTFTQAQVYITATLPDYKTVCRMGDITIVIDPMVSIRDGIVNVPDQVHIRITDSEQVTDEKTDRHTLENWEELDLQMLILSDGSKIVLKDNFYLYSFSIRGSEVFFIESYEFR